MSRSVFACLVALVLAAATRADTLTLTSGKVLTGTIQHQDQFKVVLVTDAGTLTILRGDIKAINAEPTESGFEPILAARVSPAGAETAFHEAKAALAKKRWREAGSLLEGLLELDDKAVGDARRAEAARAAVPCHLQNGDPRSASRNLVVAAKLAVDEMTRRKMYAAAEALRRAQGPRIGTTVVRTLEEALEAGAAWKADQILQEARGLAGRQTMLQDYARVDRAIESIEEHLRKADVYVPGFSRQHESEAMKGLAGNFISGATKAVSMSRQEREHLEDLRVDRFKGRAHALHWNGIVKTYHARRVAAIEALQVLAGQSELRSLYDESERSRLLDELAKLEFFEDTGERIACLGVVSHRGWGRYGR